MWRAAYLKKRCCVCHVNDAVSIPIPPQFDKAPQKNRKRGVNYSNPPLVCLNCHNDSIWLPPSKPLNIKINANGSQFDTNRVNKLPESDTHQTVVKAQAATYYSGYIRAAIIAFKYREDMSALPILVHALRQLPRPNGHHTNNSVILSVPTTDHRLVKRGFDPVTILSYYLSIHWKIPLWNGVSRIDNTVSQQGLSRQERHQNIHNAFRIDSPPPTRRIILLDDVMTTGTTLTELASSFRVVNYPLHLSAYAIACVSEK